MEDRKSALEEYVFGEDWFAKKHPESKLKYMRLASGMNIKQFSEYFEIPYRTIQNWENGQRTCPEYLLKLIQYKLENEKLKDTL